MVYVNAKLSTLNKYIGKKLSSEQIEETLKDMGMDLKGNTGGSDPELKVEITAEKMDLVSVVGIARAIKYYRGIEKKLPVYKVEKAKHKVIVQPSAKNVRPRTVCVVLRGMKLNQELLDEIIEIQEKIHDSFGRNRKKASIGIYPCDEFEFPVTFGAEDPKKIIFRPLEMDSEMNAHDILKLHETGKKFGDQLKDFDKYPVFRDKNGKVLSMPPIINSHETGRVETHHKDLFIEISGHNLTYLDNLLKVMVTTFMEMGASAEAVQVEYAGGKKWSLDLSNREDSLSLDYTNKLIGFDLKAKDIEPLLNKAMFGLKKISGDKITVEIPPFRADIWHDSDIADDIARAYGYNNIVPSTPNVVSVGGTLPISDFRDQATETMVQFGFTELYTYMLTSSIVQFKQMGLEDGDKKYVRLIDSQEQGLNMLRVRILPEILASLHINRKNKYPQKVFEVGYTIHPDSKAETKATDKMHICSVIADPKANYTQIKGVFDSFCKLNELDLKVKELSGVPFFIEGRAAEVFYKNKSVGFIGEIHPQVLTNFGLLVPACCFELILSDIFEN